MFKEAAGRDYALLKGHKAEQPRSPDEAKAARQMGLPSLVGGT
jgi:hypothetical protein